MNISSSKSYSQVVQIEPWIDEGELQELRRVIASTFLTEHELTAEFECRTKELVGVKYAIAVCNGTMALFVCLKALGIGPGDQVIVPNLTFIASANAVILAGATPVLSEIREDTFCIDVARAEPLITDRTKAIMPVHLYGQSADMDSVLSLAEAHRLKVIEDAAEGIGVKFQGRHVGTFGDMGILSYYGNKTVTCGEGGMVLTDDDELAKAVYRLKNYGRDKKGTFIHDSVGFNFSFTDLQAAVGISQMKKMPAIIKKKQAVRDRYCKELSDVAAMTPVHIDYRCDPVFWFTSFLCEDPGALSSYLAGVQIQTRRFFLPLHQQPCYKSGSYVEVAGQSFPVSESIYNRGISLPSSYLLSHEEQSRVIAEIRSFYGS